MNLTRKIKLSIVGDKEEINRVYKYLRDGIKSQNLAMNQYMSALYIAEIEKISKEDRKELNNLYGRISTSKLGSAYDKEEIKFPIGLPTAAYLAKQVRQDFEKSKRDKLMYGEVSLPTYGKHNPLLIHVDWVKLKSTNNRDAGLYHNYSSHTEFLEHLYKNDLEIFIKFANNITFKLVLGQPHKSAFLRSELQQVFEENYKICGSSIQINKDKEIILNLCMDIPDQKHDLDENIVVGVDLGIKIPAVVALNNNPYKNDKFGSSDSFFKVRKQLQEQRKQLQIALKYTSGGHGRKKKLKPLERFEQRERNFVQTYNHKISKNVVDFALKNNAKYINIEDLSNFKEKEKNKKALRNWSYYELQQFITYKAKRHGIEVRKINPAYTSQRCSRCGNLEDGQRIDQATFVCKACGLKLNADVNAARNIAMSTEFVSDDKTKQNKKEE